MPKASLLKKRAMDALLDTMAEADYESLGAHRRGEPYEPEQKGTEFQQDADHVVIPSKDMHPPSGPGDAAFFKESDPEFEMSASGMRRLYARGDSTEWGRINEFLATRDYRWLGRVSDGTEMWGKKDERVVYDPATRRWAHQVGGVEDLEGGITDLVPKLTAYGFDQPTPKTSALKSCVACECGDCIEHSGTPEVEMEQHEFFKESEPDVKLEDIGTKASGFAEGGPFSCMDCVHRTPHSKDAGGEEVDSCKHPEVMADPELKDRLLPDGTIKVGYDDCCNYVRPHGKKGDEMEKEADSETRSYGMNQPIGGSDNPTGGSDDELADEDENQELQMTGSAKRAWIEDEGEETSEIQDRLEYLRSELHAERISYEELAELQGLAEYIDPGDVELLEAAGVEEVIPQPVKRKRYRPNQKDKDLLKSMGIKARKRAATMTVSYPQFESWWEKLKRVPQALKNFSLEQVAGMGPAGPAIQINYKGKNLGYVGFPLKELEGIVGPLTRWIEKGENPDPYQMERIGSMFKSPLLKKKALVDIHETPTMLPPRDDMKRHLDQDEQDEAMLGVVDPLAKPRRPAKPEQIDPNIHIGAAKIRWKVEAAPTGQYRSFERRGWPGASYASGDAAVMIRCEDDYVPSLVREGKHAPLSVYVSHWSVTPEEKAKRGGFVWRKLKSTYPTLKEAQAAAAKVIDEHPELHPEQPAAAPAPAAPKQADYDEQLDQEGEYFLDQVQDAKAEAKRHFMEEDYLQQVADEYIPPITMEQLWKIMGEEYTAEFYGSPYTRAHDFTDEEVPEGWEGTRRLNDSTGNAGRFASLRCPLCKSANTHKVDDDAKGYSSGMVLAECRDCNGFYTTSAH